jgi:hypothetical protein
MEVHGNFDMCGNNLINAGLGIDSNFPADPQPGRFVFINAVLYLCTEIAGGLPVWVPLTKTISMERWTQTVAALEWTIPHGLNMSTVFVQVFDADGKWIIPDAIITSVLNQVTVTFSTPMIGTAILQRGETEGAAPELVAYEQSFSTTTTWVVEHHLGYNPIIRVIVGTNEVQPRSIVQNSTMQATVTFDTPQAGTVGCI